MSNRAKHDRELTTETRNKSIECWKECTRLFAERVVERQLYILSLCLVRIGISLPHSILWDIECLVWLYHEDVVLRPWRQTVLNLYQVDLTTAIHFRHCRPLYGPSYSDSLLKLPDEPPKFPVLTIPSYQEYEEMAEILLKNVVSYTFVD